MFRIMVTIEDEDVAVFEAISLIIDSLDGALIEDFDVREYEGEDHADVHRDSIPED